MKPPFVVLDFPALAGARSPGSLLFADPVEVLQADGVDDVRGVLARAEAAAADGLHAVGFLAYEAAPAFDRAFRVVGAPDVPLAWFAVCGSPTVLPAAEHADAPAATWRARTSREEYAGAVASIRAAIGRGDVYQVNYTVRLDVSKEADTAALYARLLAAQGGGYGARIHTGRFEILSASPELFFERDGHRVVTKPMKGTARRGRWQDEDVARAIALASLPKERAENVMIVDLIRNDLGRIAVPGSVTVKQLFDVQTLPTVLQMTSTIAAEIPDDATTPDVLGALFPCGSVTGAPKVAAMQAIASLESAPRGVYCGAIGHIAPGQRATFSVAIRTVTMDHDTGRAEYGTGGGITWDSAHEAEYDEVVAKAAILTHDLPRFSLFETLRLERGTYPRLTRHLDRLEQSARYFGFADPRRVRSAADRALVAHAESRAGTAAERVRVTVTPDGVATIDASALPVAGAGPLRVALAGSPVRRHNRFLYHKTTHRGVYDRHRAEHPGVFDVLLWNEDGQLTEFTIGNLVVSLDGVRCTPPRDCGLLAGTFRAELLEQGAVVEAILTADDVARAERVWLVNSVRGWVEVEMDPR